MISDKGYKLSTVLHCGILHGNTCIIYEIIFVCFYNTLNVPECFMFIETCTSTIIILYNNKTCCELLPGISIITQVLWPAENQL